MSTNDSTKSRSLMQGKVALVSGGAQGIGRAVAALLQREGASVFILDCDSAAGAQTAADLTHKNPALPVHFLSVDLRHGSQMLDAIASVRKFHDHIDVLVNNAGIKLEKSFEKITTDDWDLVLNVNLRGSFLLVQAAVPIFPQSGGAIVNISSVHATHAFPSAIPYACSKAAMVALTRNLALELAPRKIRVNCIRPGYIDTRIWEDSLRRCSDPDAVAAETAALHPVGRRGVPDDIAEAVLFLASDRSSFITGTDLVVDGGLTIRAHQ